MQISLEWLKDYLNLDEDVSKIIELLTFSGIEVEDHYLYGDIPDSVIIVKILECEKIEGTDHLQLCSIDSGKETYQVVCGAPNCRAGLITSLALPGTKLPGLEIKKAKIRGIDSNGMLCSEKELGLSDDHSGIVELPTDAPLAKSLKQYLCLPDVIFELEITPNRPDLLGYQGIATDLAASLSQKPMIKGLPELQVKEPFNDISSHLSLEIKEPELCSRYIARMIQGVTIKDSPLWLKLRLLKSGLRPINNVVDVTNYVMLETGHPLHAFDYDKLSNTTGKPGIVVRKAQNGDVFTALDNIFYTLRNEDLVIADADKPIALAGVIGGTNSHITETSTNIVLEAACFNHSNIRRTAYLHKITTDSSYRFERQLSPETCEYASLMAVQLIKEIAGGTLITGKLDEWSNKTENLIIPLRPSRIKKLTGIVIHKEDIIKCLSNLGLVYHGEGCYKKYYPTSIDTIPRIVRSQDDSMYFEIRENKDELVNRIDPVEEALFFSIPSKRVDLTREVDLVEEVIRIYGMDKVTPKNKPSVIMDRYSFIVKRKLSDYLVQNGFQEVVNLSFTDPNQLDILFPKDSAYYSEPISLLNPQNSNLSVMRTDLLPQLINTAAYNLNHGIRHFRIFELNKVFVDNKTLPKNEILHLTLLASSKQGSFNWKDKPRDFGFFDIKGIVEELFSLLGINNIEFRKAVYDFLIGQEQGSFLIDNQVIALFGKLKPEIAAKFSIDVVELKQDFWVADINLDSLIDSSRLIRRQYKPVHRFPAIERDLSLVIEKDISHYDIQTEIKKITGNRLLNIYLYDEYLGKQIPDGFRSLTYKLIICDNEKTLTDEEVDVIIDLIIKHLKSMWNINLR